MTPEEKARRDIDRQLAQCGWLVQDYRRMNISAGPGIAVREFSLATGEADYLLYADAKAVGVIEAKPEGHSLTGIETQSGKYLDGLPKLLRDRLELSEVHKIELFGDELEKLRFGKATC